MANVPGLWQTITLSDHFEIVYGEMQLERYRRRKVD